MSGDYFIKKAYGCILQNDFEGAVEWFQQAIKIEPDNASYHYKLSITLARNDKLPKAIYHAEQACSLDEENAAHSYHLKHLRSRELVMKAERLIGKSSFKLHMASNLLRKAVTLDPLSVEGYLLLAVTFAYQSNYSSAISAIHEVLKLDPVHELALQLQMEYHKKIAGRM